ncbi:radical SAM/SPASM domain-containing protein [Terrilactibacillus laevilacticus]|uniref:radical SAM/SPASM domain-containing protein n=1 Tax=Terrilactibacillus laevilacticus TaxID=1380157 RepID=UPI001FE6D78F|nr:radical SAM protein [Terrilactibacillus laevilacticus]
MITNKVCENLQKNRFDRICISLDGSCKEKHNPIRGLGSFEKTISGIKRLKKYNLPVSTLFTITKNNIDDLFETISLNESLGIEYMTIMVVCPTGRGAENDVLLPKEKWYPTLLKLSEMKKENKFKLKLKIVPPNESEVFWCHYFPLKYYNRLDLLSVWNQKMPTEDNQRKVSCQAGVKSASIAADGNVYGCDLMMNIPDFCAGNIKEQSFNEIWYESKIFTKLRNLNIDDLDDKCSSCVHKWCGGGCRSAAYNLTGSITGADMSCYKLSEENFNDQKIEYYNLQKENV